MFGRAGIVKSVTSHSSHRARPQRRHAGTEPTDTHKMSYKNGAETYLMIYKNDGALAGNGSAQCASFSASRARVRAAKPSE